MGRTHPILKMLQVILCVVDFVRQERGQEFKRGGCVTAGLGGNHSSWLMCVRKAASAEGQCSETLLAPREGTIQGLLTWEQLPFSQWFPSHNGSWL